jgi:putative DNA methylase
VHPGGDDRLPNRTWTGAQGLADDVRHFGKWMRDEAERRTGHLYPKATLPDGSKANVIAWIWARTVSCPNPACRATMPLARSFWLGKKRGREYWIRPVIEGKRVSFEVGTGRRGPPIEGTVKRTGATCLVCESPVSFDYVRSEGREGRLSAQLMAIVADGPSGRVYLPAEREHERRADVEPPDEMPESELPSQALGFRVQAYGMTHHSDLFTNRQLVTLAGLCDLVVEAHARVAIDAGGAGLSDEEAEGYADAVATYLGVAVSRLADMNCSLARWKPIMDQSIGLFARQAIPMVWDFAEVNPYASAAGDLEVSLTTVCKVLNRLPVASEGSAELADARVSAATSRIVATDPPYYDNIGYADLSDFFYVWLRRSLRSIHPELFGTMLTPKADELIATPYRFEGSKQKAERFFEDGFVRAFANFREVQVSGYPLTFFYAFKQSESSEDGLVSTGWETMLDGLLKAGLTVTATWPMRTELGNRLVASGTNALASSIVLASRPRPEAAGVTDRRGFIAALKSEVPRELELLRQASIAPVDLAQAAIGPGMAVFSRYAKVIESSGEPMRVRTALGLINQVLAEVLDEQEGDFDSQTRWAIKWFEQHGLDEGSSGLADQLCRTYGTALNALDEAGIIETKRGKTRLLERSELPDEWDPAADSRVPIWEATQHMVKRLDEQGEQAAADLLRRLGGLGDAVQLLAYRLHSISDRKGWTSEAIAYNLLGASWSEIRKLAQAPRPLVVEAGRLL